MDGARSHGMRDTLIALLVIAVGVLGYVEHSQTTALREQEKRVSDVAAKLEARAKTSAATATEVFNLRSRCAELGQKIMESNIIGPALTQTQVSHYDPRSNRCYSLLDVSTADLSTPEEKEFRSSYLYDAQTEEMLAFTKIHGGKKLAHIFMDGWREFAGTPGAPELGRHPLENQIPEFDFITVQGFISTVMKDNRQ
jgi:hypothetical protein